MRSLLVTAGAAFFWMLSPESLTILTHGAALGPAGFILPVVLFALLCSTGGRIIHTAAPVGKEPPGPLLLSFSGWVTLLGFGGIIGTTLFGSTGILVTAGFTFNEVFLYYFPNFGFAFLLLFIVAGLHLFFPGRAVEAQGILVLVVTVCLLVLTIAGLLSGLPGQESSIESKGRALVTMLPVVLIFAGFEQRNQRPGWTWAGGLRGWLVLFVIVVLLGWMTVSGLLVPSRKLVFSTVPYMTAASTIAGQGGRLIMGIAIVGGSLAAVSGLFSVSKHFIAALLHDDQRTATGRSVVLALTVAIGVSMGGGFAGNPKLEGAILAAVTIWLMHGGFRVLQVSLPAGRTGGVLVGGAIVVLPVISALLFRDKAVISVFFACLLAGAVLCIMLLRLMHEHFTSQRRIINEKETLS